MTRKDIALAQLGVLDALHRRMKPITRETVIERRRAQFRWSALFGGAALGIGLWILLQTLGMGLGLSAVDTDDAGNLRGIGIGTGVWTLIAPLIAMFVGAWLTGRMSGSRDLRVGAMHGSVMWALVTAIGLWTLLGAVSMLAAGAARVGGAAVDATSTITSGAVNARGQAGDAMSALGVGTDDLVAPINQRLAQQGKPQITAPQLNATIRAVAQRGVRQGRLDRQLLVQELARNTSLSRADAEDIANQFADRFDRLAARAQELGQDVKHAALETADKVGKTLLLAGLMMLLSLAAAVGGGALGARGSRRDASTEP